MTHQSPPNMCLALSGATTFLLPITLNPVPSRYQIRIDGTIPDPIYCHLYPSSNDANQPCTIGFSHILQKKAQ